MGSTAVACVSPPDAARWGVIVTGLRSGVLATEELLANGAPFDGISPALLAGPPGSNPLAVPAEPVRAAHLP